MYFFFVHFYCGYYIAWNMFCLAKVEKDDNLM